MELFNEKPTESITFRDHNLVHSIRIVVCNKRYPCTVCHTKLWITGPCYVQEMSHLTIQASCYAFDKHCRNYGSTSTVLHAPVWYSADSSGCYNKRSITNAKVAPTDVILMLLGCIVCILITSLICCLPQRGQNSF